MLTIETPAPPREQVRGRLPRREAQTIRIVLADEPSLWRDGLALLLRSQPDLEIAGESADSSLPLARLMPHRPDLVLCDSDRARAILPELLLLRHRGSELKLIVLNISLDPNAVSPDVRREAAAIVPQNSPSGFLLQAIRGAARFDPASPTLASAMSTRDHFQSLSARERQLASLVGLGWKNREISDSLFISEQTVKNHLRNIFIKTGTKDRLHLALSLVQDGLYK